MFQDLTPRRLRAAILGSVALVGLILAPAVARADAEADIRALAAAIEAAGCVITNANESDIITAAGLADDDDAAFAALQALIGSRQLRLGSDSGTLTTGACAHHAGNDVAPEVLAERRAAVIERVAAAGCRITPQSIDEILRDTGMTEAEQVETIMSMAADGLAHFEMDGQTDQFILTAGPCAEDAAADPDDASGAEPAGDVMIDRTPETGTAEAPDVMSPGDRAAADAPVSIFPRDALISAIAAVGCTITEANQNQLLAASGLSQDVAGELLGAMIRAGEIDFQGTSATLLIGPCAGSETAQSPAAAPAPAGDAATTELALRLVEGIQASNCAATGDELSGLIEMLGGEAALQAAAAALNAGGHVLAPRSPRGSVLLSEQLCSASGVHLARDAQFALRPNDAAAPGSRLGGARLLLAELRASQCLFSRNNALGYLDHLGVSQPQAVLDRMAQTGLIRVEGEFLAVSDLACTGDSEVIDSFLAAAFDGVTRKR